MKNNNPTPFNLDQIHVAAPCDADWEKMAGNDRVRFCALCKKNVYNLSDLSRPQAEALLREKEGNLCIQFYRRADGKVLTDNCPVGLRAIRNRVRWATVVASAAFVALGAFVGLRSAKAAGVSIREVQPFKVMQTVQPVKALVDWLDPVLLTPPTPPMVMGKIAMPPAVIPPPPTVPSDTNFDCKWTATPKPVPVPVPVVEPLPAPVPIPPPQPRINAIRGRYVRAPESE